MGKLISEACFYSRQHEVRFAMLKYKNQIGFTERLRYNVKSMYKYLLFPSKVIL